MKRLVQDLKTKEFSHLYLLYGKEPYLIRQYKDSLKNALVAADDTMNLNVFSGKDINMDDVEDIVGTMPFFASNRVVIIEDSGFVKTGNDKSENDKSRNNRFAELISNIPDTTYIIMTESEIDKRSRVFKAISKKGYAALCELSDEAALKKWILGILKRENKQITQDALNLLLERTGTSMEGIRSELEKLICYRYYDEGITAQDVEKLCIVQVQNKIFDMVEAVSRKEQKQALELYYDLLALKEAPMKILLLIARQFNMLLMVKEMTKKGYAESEIAGRTGLNAYYLKKKYIPQASRFKTSQLMEALRRCVEAEEDIKTGRMSDLLSVELIIVGLSST